MIDLRTEDAYTQLILSNETESVRHLCSCDELLNIVIIHIYAHSTAAHES